jgi:hypothetical protein
VDIGQPDISYYKIQLDNIGGKHIQAQLAKPNPRMYKNMFFSCRWMLLTVIDRHSDEFFST